MLDETESAFNLAELNLIHNETITKEVIQALDDIQKKGLSYPVPNHLKDTHYKDAKSKYGFGVEYKYPHDDPSTQQEYLPEPLKDRKYLSRSGKK